MDPFHQSLAGPSTLAIPSLDPIPGSASVTPFHSNDASPEVEDEVDLSEPVAGPSNTAGTPYFDAKSRRSSISGSYFPPAELVTTYPPSASGTTTPGDRPRPAPISIPAATPDEPLFSSYPHTGVSRKDSKGKGRSFTFPLKSTFSLRSPRRRVASSGHPSRSDSSTPSDENSSSEPTGTSSPVNGRPKTRRRASTISHTSPPLKPIEVQSRRSSFVSPLKSLHDFRRRRASLGSPPTGIEFRQLTGDNIPHWPAMPQAEAKRLDPRPILPFSYQQPADSEYTLQSVSTVATTRPLASPGISRAPTPSISPRRSSLGTGMLGLTEIIPSQPSFTESGELLIPDDMFQPHDPPARRSSLIYESSPMSLVNSAEGAPDARSVLSSSQTNTTTSFEGFSPHSAQHPLSSATTSISRSAKSGTEDESSKDFASLSAVRLQRSLEWEAKQTRHRRRLEKRKLILLELVETEVAYSQDLKTLVTVFLPQLYALPAISERRADLVSRNAKDLMVFHDALSAKMVDVLKEEKLTFEAVAEEDLAVKVERVSRKLAEILVEDIANFSAYNDFCAGSIAAGTLVRHIALRTDYDAFERRCQIICASVPTVTLQDLLSDAPSSMTPTNRNRLHFRDYLIMPIQRVCRYPLLLEKLLETATASSPDADHPSFDHAMDDYDVGVDVERALGAMRGVAEEADEARRKKESEVKTATIIERMEIHPVITPLFLRSLGTCRLIGSLDVLHHHPTIAPMVPPVKVKYLAAFLFRGYLILAKVKKGKMYEPKHFLPLEVFELIDITEGFLPHSIRLTLREHNFDLAASCEAEKEAWAAALVSARDESTVPPFELPASVSPFAARSRRMSTTVAPGEIASLISASPSLKRHTILGITTDSSPTVPSVPSVPEGATLDTTVVESPGETASPASPAAVSFGFTPERRNSTILLRRASAAQRLTVDRGLVDVFSDSCAQARSKASLHHGLFLPDSSPRDMRDRLSMRDSTVLRRRKSFLDNRSPSSDMLVSGEIKGLVIPSRAPSIRGISRLSTRSSLSGVRRSEESSTEVEGADDTATSDFGTLRGGAINLTRNSSSRSFGPSPVPSPRPSFRNLRKAAIDQSPVRGLLSMNRRKTSSAYNLNNRPPVPTRAKSTPVSPVITPFEPPPPLNQTHSDPVTSYFGTTTHSSTDIHLQSTMDLTHSHHQVFAQGAGLTNVLPSSQEDTRHSLLGTLKRNMSFAKSRSSISSNNLEEYLSGPNNASFSLTSVVPNSNTPDKELDEVHAINGKFGATSRNTSSGVLSEKSDVDLSLEGSPGEGVLRRKRSARLLRTLSRFTPFEVA